MGRLRKGEEPGGQPSRLSWPSSLASDAYVRNVSFWSQVSPELGPCNWTEREQVGQVPGQTCESSPLPACTAPQTRVQGGVRSRGLICEVAVHWSTSDNSLGRRTGC